MKRRLWTGLVSLIEERFFFKKACKSCVSRKMRSLFSSFHLRNLPPDMRHPPKHHYRPSTSPPTAFPFMIGLGIWGIRRPGSLSGSSGLSWAVFGVSRGTISCRGGHCHLGMLPSATAVGWVVHVNLNECQDPKFPRRTLHSNEMMLFHLSPVILSAIGW